MTLFYAAHISPKGQCHPDESRAFRLEEGSPVIENQNSLIWVYNAKASKARQIDDRDENYLRNSLRLICVTPREPLADYHYVFKR